MPLLGWFAVGVGWLTIGALLGMAKWAVYHNDTLAKTWSLKQAFRVLLFPQAATNPHGWAYRKEVNSDNNSVPAVATFKSKETYMAVMSALAPFALVILLPGLVGGLLFCVAAGIARLVTGTGRLFTGIVARITKRSAQKKNRTETATERLMELRDSELVKQQSRMHEQRVALSAQVDRLRNDRTTTTGKAERLVAANDQFAGAYQTTLGRIEQLLSTKQEELARTDEALVAVGKTLAQISGIVELLDISAYMDTIDPRTNGSSQQLLRDAYTCVEACRIVIARAQDISIGIQTDSADVEELARQVDAGWTADKERILKSTELLGRLAGMTEQKETVQPALRLTN